MLGLPYHGEAVRRRWRGRAEGGGTPAPTPTPAPTINSVAANGWEANMPTPVDLAFDSVSLSRQGYDSTGATTTISESVVTTKRVRQPFPNQASLTASTVALSDYVYATDTISGVTNNSTEVSPKPIAKWVSPDRDIVGNSVTVEIVAFHRNGVAAVEFRASDGTTTVTALTASPVVSPVATDKNAVIVYRATLDISALADNANITVNAKVWPRIGAAASVRDSIDQAAHKDFSPRTYRRNTSRAAAPPIVYVAAGGNDTTGNVGTDDAAAAAAPCATLTGAINRARTVLGTAAGSLDGLRIRLAAGTAVLTANPTANTVNAYVTIERGTGVSRASAVVEFGAANFHSNVTYLRYRDCAIRRMGVLYIFNTTNGQVLLEDCDYDANGTGSALVSNNNMSLLFNGVTFTGTIASTFNLGTTYTIDMIRGCSLGTALSNDILAQHCIVGNLIRGSRTLASSSQDLSGGVIAFNRWMDAGTASGPNIVINQSSTAPEFIDGFAVVQNVFEHRSSTTNTMLAISADDMVADTRHIIVWHNTLAGFGGQGRSNLLYDETTGNTRFHRLQSFIGNIHVQLNTKHDVFHSDGTHIGGWGYNYSVGVRDEWSRYLDAGSGGFKQDYPGVNASIGTSLTGAGNDPLFTNYQATTQASGAGAGGGDYTLQGGSPARGRVANSPLPFDLTGAARSGTVATGAYV